MKKYNTPEIMALEIEETAYGWFSHTPEGENDPIADPFHFNPFDNLRGQKGENKGDDKGDTSADDLSGAN